MRERRETDAPLAPRGERPPVERKSRGRRLEGDRVGGDPRPCVPKRDPLGNVGVLDRPSMPDEALEHAHARTGEADPDQPRMAERAFDRRGERAEVETVAFAQQRRRGTILRALTVIAGAEDDCDEAFGVAKP